MTAPAAFDGSKYDQAEALAVFRQAVAKVIEMRAGAAAPEGDIRDLMRWAEWRIETLQTALERSAGERVPVNESKPPVFAPVWTNLGVRVWDGGEWRDAYTPAAPIVRSRWEMQRDERIRRARPCPAWWLRERR